jgi:hypothetical protein
VPEELRRIRCHHGRASDEPCMQPAIYEVLGLYPEVLCEEHARERVAENLNERWEQFGRRRYASWCEDAFEEIYQFGNQSENLVTGEVLEEAYNYLMMYELPRARRAALEEASEAGTASTEERSS